MSSLRGASVAAGIAAVVLGIGSVVTGRTFGFRLDYLFVTLIGVLALLQGIRYVARRRREIRFTETGDPELRYEVPTPGDDFDRDLATSRSLSSRTVKRRRAIRERLREAAIEALAVRENRDRTAAERLVAQGEWTDDPYAAALLAEGSVSLPPTAWLRNLFRRKSQFAHDVSRAVDAIEALGAGRAADGDGRLGPSADSDDDGRFGPSADSDGDGRGGDTGGTGTDRRDSLAGLRGRIGRDGRESDASTGTPPGESR